MRRAIPAVDILMLSHGTTYLLSSAREHSICPAQVSQHSDCVLQVVTQGPARGSNTTPCPEDPTKSCRGSKFKITGIVVGGVEGDTYCWRVLVLSPTIKGRGASRMAQLLQHLQLPTVVSTQPCSAPSLVHQ